MEDQTKQEIIVSKFLSNKRAVDQYDTLQLTLSIKEMNDILYHYFDTINNSLAQEQIKENTEKYIINIKFLFQAAKVTFDKIDLSTIIKILLMIYLKTNDIELKHDVLDLIEYIMQQDQNIFLFIIKNTDFIQNFLLKLTNFQTYEEKIQLIHFLSIIPFTENAEIVQFYAENNFIDFICLEFQEFSSLADNQDPETLSIITILINKMYKFYSLIHLLSYEKTHLILSIFSLVIENKDEFYLFELFFDDIISSIIQSIKIINPSLLIEIGLYNQLLSYFYSIDCYKHDKKLIFIFFTDFFEFHSPIELLKQFDFELLCKSLINLHNSDLYPFLFNFLKTLLPKKSDFIELLFQFNFFNCFHGRIKNLSYVSQYSFWSLILTIITRIPFEHSKEILNDQNLINNLFDFLSIVDEDFVLSHIDHLIESSTESFQFFQYYQSCLYDFVLGFYDTKPEIFDKFQDFISIKDKH